MLTALKMLASALQNVPVSVHCGVHNPIIIDNLLAVLRALLGL
jgi:hypothetical protein